MQVRTLFWVAGAAAAAAGGWVAWDALTVTDEERIEAFTDLVGGEVTDARIRRALAFAEPARQPVELEVRGSVTVYEGPDGAAELEAHARRGLRRFRGDTIRVLSEAIEVRGDEATATQRLLTDQGMIDVEWLLHRHGEDGEDWLVGRARLR